ncbi:MAG: hypothetical protein RQ756_07730 [Flavobacteriaceae bacterium]|nr:hypothetical protein [Flavobacteriaceae bacterium]
MNNDKKPTYREVHGTTRVGDFLRKIKGIAPGALDLLGTITGVESLKELGKKIEGSDELTAEQKALALAELELDLREYELEIRDRESARQRQVETAKAGRKDLLYNVTGFVGLGVFAFVVYSIIFLEVPKDNKEIFIHLIGIVEGVALAIFGFFFGSSDKEKTRIK